MVANEERGDDSTGVGLVMDDEVVLVKDTVPASTFINIPDYRIAQTGRASAALGHTRLATTGAKTRRNAHPFFYEGERRIVGTHNGMVNNWHVAKSTYPNMEVDSEAIFAYLAEGRTPTEIWGDADSDTDALLRGQFACVWMDVNEGRPHLMRSGNPLFVLQDRNRKRLYYSSLIRPLMSAAAMTMPERLYSISEVKDDHAYRLDPDDPTGEWEVTALDPFASLCGTGWDSTVYQWSDVSECSVCGMRSTWVDRDKDAYCSSCRSDATTLGEALIHSEWDRSTQATVVETASQRLFVRKLGHFYCAFCELDHTECVCSVSLSVVRSCEWCGSSNADYEALGDQLCLSCYRSTGAMPYQRSV